MAEADLNAFGVVRERWNFRENSFVSDTCEFWCSQLEKKKAQSIIQGSTLGKITLNEFLIFLSPEREM